VLATFEREPELIDVVALHLLERHLAPSLHEEILEAVGLKLGTPAGRGGMPPSGLRCSPPSRGRLRSSTSSPSTCWIATLPRAFSSLSSESLAAGVRPAVVRLGREA
jgi:hypothetical protein